MEYNQLSLFARAYIEAMLWTECNPDNEELDGKDFSDFAPETVMQIVQDCEKFQGHNMRLLALAGDDDQNGHDFWLTRNHHGAGFWDRGYGQIGEELTTAAQAYKECTLVLGDNGLLYLEG